MEISNLESKQELEDERLLNLRGYKERGGHGLTMYDGGSGEHDMVRVDRPSCLALNVAGFSSFVLLHLP